MFNVNTSKYSSLWQNLVDDGYNVGTYDEFVNKLKDSSKVSTLETFLKKEYNLTDSILENIFNMEKMLEKEEASNSKFPSVFKMGRNLVADTWRGMKATAKGGHFLSRAETASARLDICKTCPFFKYDQENPETGIADGRCVKCGCFMSTKVHWANVRCPINKWLEEDKKSKKS